MSTISDVKGATTKSAGVQIGSTGKQRPGDCESEDIRCGSPAMCCRRSSSHSTLVAPPSRPTSTAASSGDMFTALSTPIGIAAVVDDDFAPPGMMRDDAEAVAAENRACWDRCGSRRVYIGAQLRCGQPVAANLGTA